MKNFNAVDLFMAFIGGMCLTGILIGFLCPKEVKVDKFKYKIGDHITLADGHERVVVACKKGLIADSRSDDNIYTLNCYIYNSDTQIYSEYNIDMFEGSIELMMKKPEAEK